MSKDYYNNFSMTIPRGIMTHPDGTPMSFFKSDEDREKVRLYLLGEGISDEQWRSMPGAEKESIIAMAYKKFDK